MSKGLNRFEGKDKRRQRLRNHIAKDLRSPKYGQRVIDNKNKRLDREEYQDFEDE